MNRRIQNGGTGSNDGGGGIQDGGAGSNDGGGGIQDGGMGADYGGRVCGIMRGNYDKPNGKRKWPCIMRG